MPASASDVADRLQNGLHKVVVGQDRSVFALLVALLAGGHVLIEGVPGTAKTLLVRALAILLGADFRRIQFSSDEYLERRAGSSDGADSAQFARHDESDKC